MAKWILKYKLHGNDQPWYVDEGLYEINNWRYGISKDDQSCYIPSDVEKMSETQFKAFMRGEHMQKRDPETGRKIILSNAEKDTEIERILKGRVQKEKNV